MADKRKREPKKIPERLYYQLKMAVVTRDLFVKTAEVELAKLDAKVVTAMKAAGLDPATRVLLNDDTFTAIPQ